MGTFWATWIISFGVLVLFAIWLGGRMRQSVWGIFIDSRNKWSLSQFQLVSWTFVGLPLIIAVAIWRARSNASTAWNFTIPGELIALMGISLGSTVAALAIKSTKDAQRADFVAAREPNLPKPPFQDMFGVEEGASALKSIDITKFQNFVITISLLLSYIWIVIEAFRDLPNGGPPNELPAFSQAMIGLLALSHGGYLIGKIPNREGDPAQNPVLPVAPQSAQAAVPPSGDEPGREAIPARPAVMAKPTIVKVSSLG